MVKLRVQDAWSSWRKLTGVLYDRKIPLRLKAKIYQTIIRPGSDVWERMLGDEGDQQEEDCYHGDEDASRDLGVSRRDHMRNEEIRRILHLSPIDEGYAQWPSSLVWTCPETRCNQRHPQSDGAGNTRYQTTRAPQEDMTPTDEGRHGGRGCYPRCGPRPEGVEKEDKATPTR